MSILILGSAMSEERLATLRTALLEAYNAGALWHNRRPQFALPEGVARGSDEHLVFLTLVYAISGGREPEPLWAAAREAFTAAPELFDPKTLAYAQPQAFVEPLQQQGISQKSKTDGVTWHRIGKAIMMRGQGSVKKILAQYGYEARALWEMLQENKATFPVLSGPQTGPRWLWGLATAGEQPLENADRLPVPVSAAVARALDSLQLDFAVVSAEVWEAAVTLGQRGCAQRKKSQPVCPVVAECPVVAFCRYRP